MIICVKTVNTVRNAENGADIMSTIFWILLGAFIGALITFISMTLVYAASDKLPESQVESQASYTDLKDKPIINSVSLNQEGDNESSN